MNIIICGAGQVGSHAAEELASKGIDITLIDTDAERLRAVADSMDVATLCGNAATAEVLADADVADADLLLAATSSDEVNLLAATVGKHLGAGKSIARVHRSSFYDQRGLDYQAALSIDRLICPEYSTARAIAADLRNPGALAIEHFGRGTIQMQELPVAADATAIGKPLSELVLRPGIRLAAITRNRETFIPDGTSSVRRGDSVILVGNQSEFHDARKLFHDDKLGRRKVVIMGGTSTAVWLCRALHDRNFAIRLFEIDRKRCEELADKLDWVTVIQANPADRSVFEEENLAQSDVFVALRTSDEDNIITSLLAKTMGVTQVLAVVGGTMYLDLVYHLGVDKRYTPSELAVAEIKRALDESPLSLLSTLADGVVDAYQVQVTQQAPAVGKRLRDLQLSNCIIAGIRRGEKSWVPSADDDIEPGDTALLIALKGTEKELRKLFAPG